MDRADPHGGAASHYAFPSEMRPRAQSYQGQQQEQSLVVVGPPAVATPPRPSSYLNWTIANIRLNQRRLEGGIAAYDATKVHNSKTVNVRNLVHNNIAQLDLNQERYRGVRLYLQYCLQKGFEAFPVRALLVILLLDSCTQESRNDLVRDLESLMLWMNEGFARAAVGDEEPTQQEYSITRESLWRFVAIQELIPQMSVDSLPPL